MKRRAEDMNMDVNIVDSTGSLSQINIQGPNSRKLMEKLTSEDMSNESFPFRAAREIDIEFARCTYQYHCMSSHLTLTHTYTHRSMLSYHVLG